MPARLETPSASHPFRPSRVRGVSLLWWVLLPNAGVLVVAFVLLAVTPITVSHPIKAGELALLFVGLAMFVALNVVLLRRVLSPLVTLADVMSSVDPDRPGRRLVGVNPRSAEGRALAEAFNSMLDRLERARREAARTALAAQEAERLRVARELHDEIGQTLTAVMLQAERAADEIRHTRRWRSGGSPKRCTRAWTSCAESRASCVRRLSTTWAWSTR